MIGKIYTLRLIQQQPLLIWATTCWLKSAKFLNLFPWLTEPICMFVQWVFACFLMSHKPLSISFNFNLSISLSVYLFHWLSLSLWVLLSYGKLACCAHVRAALCVCALASYWLGMNLVWMHDCMNRMMCTKPWLKEWTNERSRAANWLTESLAEWMIVRLLPKTNFKWLPVVVYYCYFINK